MRTSPLLDAEGQTHTLGELCDSKMTLLVFFRHLACIACRDHLHQLTQNAEQFAQRSCQVLIITQAQPPLLASFLKQYPQLFRFFGDPTRTLYRAFELEQVSWWKFCHPRVIWGYCKILVRGKKLYTPTGSEEMRQLGGDFLVDSQGEIVQRYTSHDPTERPGIDILLAKLDFHTQTGKN
jgi:hypothetical protein